MSTKFQTATQEFSREYSRNSENSEAEQKPCSAGAQYIKLIFPITVAQNKSFSDWPGRP